MKRAIFLSIIVAGLLFASACGNAASVEPAATQGAPVSGSGAQPGASSGDTEVDVTLADNTIQSSLTTFKVGVPYRFVIINNGNHLHDFNINTPVAGGDTQAAKAAALLVVPQEQLPIGGGTTVT